MLTRGNLHANKRKLKCLQQKNHALTTAEQETDMLTAGKMLIDSRNLTS